MKGCFTVAVHALQMLQQKFCLCILCNPGSLKPVHCGLALLSRVLAQAALERAQTLHPVLLLFITPVLQYDDRSYDLVDERVLLGRGLKEHSPLQWWSHIQRKGSYGGSTNTCYRHVIAKREGSSTHAHEQHRWVAAVLVRDHQGCKGRGAWVCLCGVGIPRCILGGHNSSSLCMCDDSLR
jgi:hypothetical protein